MHPLTVIYNFVFNGNIAVAVCIIRENFALLSGPNTHNTS